MKKEAKPNIEYRNSKQIRMIKFQNHKQRNEKRSKYEYRRSKFETNSNDQNLNDTNNYKTTRSI